MPERSIRRAISTMVLPAFSVDVALPATNAARSGAVMALAEAVGDNPWHLRYHEQFDVERDEMLGTYTAGVTWHVVENRLTCG